MAKQDKLLRKYLSRAYDRLQAVDNDATKLAEPYRTLVLIESAQGIIDNGGLIYFFESDWPGCPPYSAFSDAYRRIGMPDAADDLDRAAKSFGFQEPEKYRERRQAFMAKQFGSEDDDGEEIEGQWEVQWTDRICGNEDVWTMLSDWLRTQEKNVG